MSSKCISAGSQLSAGSDNIAALYSPYYLPIISSYQVHIILVFKDVK